MLASYESLLRLPAALRCSALLQPARCLRPLELHSTVSGRTFSNTATPLARQVKATKTPQKPLRKGPTSPNTVPKPQPPPPSPPKSPAPPPRPPTPSSSPRSGPQILNLTPTLRNLLHDSKTGPLILYTSPSHTSFYLISYIIGFSLTLGGLINLSFTYSDDERVQLPWLAKLPIAFAALMCTGIGVAAAAAPWKLVRSVTLLTRSTGPVGKRTPEAFIRFQMKPAFPLFQNDLTIETAPYAGIFYDRRVASSDFAFTSIPLDQAATTSTTTNNSTDPTASPENTGILSPLRSLNTGLLNAWPILRRDVRRMFMRDGIMNLHITGHGNWKMDLQGCELLDGGKVFEQLAISNPHFSRGIAGWLKKFAG